VKTLALALALALLTAILGLRFGTFVASGADAYGYVSEADLWLRRTLIIEEPLAGDAPWRYANFTLAPLGYHPGDRGGTMVPTYSPGLPILMAGFKAIGGEQAKYWVVPLLGALGVWLTYLLASRLGGGDAGVVAALALLVSPAFLFQLMWPMSDVPVMTWWLASSVLALGNSRWHAAGAGLAAAAAIVTRPNLVVLAIPLVVLIAMRQSGWRGRIERAVIFGVAALPGPLAIAALNNHLFGSPLRTGYGTIATIYSWQYFTANITRYPVWLIETQTPFVLLALLAPRFIPHATAEARRVAWFGLAFSVVLFLSYLWYTPFDNWTYLRFLLPAYPLLLAAAAAVFVYLAPAAPRPRMLAFATLALMLTVVGLWQGRSAFVVHAEEARYLSAARFAAALPDNAAILCNQHSGSIRYYANRLTLRYEWLEPDAYTQAIDYLHSLGRPVFVVLDDFERDVFRSRYAKVIDVSWLDRPMLVASNRVYFYQLP
jgi:asparagine N-glycosylation enzyme membrane subunit Stt3